MEPNYTVEELKSVPELNLVSYMKAVEHLAQGIQDQTGIPKIVPMIQSAHESRSGNSGLARNHCNLFGITATDKWKKDGKAIAFMPTWEHVAGRDVKMGREFRAYGSWKESFADWATILTGLSVYKTAVALMKDGKITEGITEMGKVYATDPAYAKKLIDLYRAVA